MKSKGLSKRQAGNVILVAPTAEIRKLEEEEIESLKVVERLEPLKTEYIQINYAKAENFRNILLGNSSQSADGCTVQAGGSGNSGNSGGSQGGNNSQRNNNRNSSGNNSSGDESYSLLSQRGTAIVDSRTNTLIVKDTSKNLVEISKMIQLLDRQVRQVLIEARIVIAQEGFAQELGVKFGAAYTGNQFQIGGSTGGSTSTGDGIAEAVTPVLSNLAASNPYGALGMTLADGANYILNLEITALQDDTKAEFVSNPKILTSDRCKAVIDQGEEIPYQTVSQNGTQTEFKDAKLVLEVTPQITPSGSVIMELVIKKDVVSPRPNGTGIPSIDARSVTTSVRIEDGETVVLGGVFEGTELKLISSVPWFSDLPLVGWMFRKTVNSDTKNELLIFITPKIMKDSMRMR